MTNLRAAAVLVLASLLVASGLSQTPVKSDSIVSYRQNTSGVDFKTLHGTLRVRFCTDSMAHVTFEEGDHSAHPQPWIVQTEGPAVTLTVAEDAARDIVISTKRLRVIAERDSASLLFQDVDGKALVRESASPRPRDLTPLTVDGEKTYHADAYFDLTQDEAIYGLGQHQSGLLNQRGTDLLMMQDNTNISLPFLLSSRGYGLLWNSASLGRFENHFQPKLVLRADVADAVDYYLSLIHI